MQNKPYQGFRYHLDGQAKRPEITLFVFGIQGQITFSKFEFYAIYESQRLNTKQKIVFIKFEKIYIFRVVLVWRKTLCIWQVPSLITKVNRNPLVETEFWG